MIAIVEFIPSLSQEHKKPMILLNRQAVLVVKGTDFRVKWN